MARQIKAKVKLDKRALEIDLVRRIEKVIDAEPLKQEIGLFVTDRIRFQARIKEPLNDTGDFKDLRPITVKNREYLERYNVTQSTYKANRSNLTFTGQFLNSIGFKARRFGIELLFKGKRKGYKTGPNSRQKKPPTNAQLARYLGDLGYFVFTKKGIEKNRKIGTRITSIVRRFIRNNLR